VEVRANSIDTRRGIEIGRGAFWSVWMRGEGSKARKRDARARRPLLWGSEGRGVGSV